MKKNRVLIVDDTPSNLDSLINILQDEYEIIVANNGEKAIKLSKSEHKPDIILLDIVMPGMDGYEVCRRIKSDKETQEIPIIFVTVLRDDASETKGLSLGAVDYIYKPFNPILVKARVKNNVKLKLYRDELESLLKENEEIMIAQSRHAELGNMISVIAHQWKQPLTAISAIANRILLDIELDDFDINNIKEHADTVNFQVQELSKIIGDFTHFFQSDKEVQSITVQELVYMTDSIVNASLSDNGIVLVLSIEDVLINTHVRELMQVLVNILVNAKDILLERKITTPKIDLSSKHVDQSLIITICDNAGGIDNEIQDNIFEKYFTTKRGKGGTGIGLYIAKKIVEDHLNGSISVKNKDDGACFKIQIPLKQD